MRCTHLLTLEHTQREGVGSALVRERLRRAERTDIPLVVVYRAPLGFASWGFGEAQTVAQMRWLGWVGQSALTWLRESPMRMSRIQMLSCLPT